MLQRVYVYAFNTKEELNDYLKFLEEAQKRDHRKLGKELGLFMISDYAKEAVYALNSNGIINGIGNGYFEPMGNATRAQAAQIIYNMLTKGGR